MRGFGAPELWTGREAIFPYEKPRQYPKMLTGFFVLSPLSRLLHLNRQCPLIGFVPGRVNNPKSQGKILSLDLNPGMA